MNKVGSWVILVYHNKTSYKS